MRLIDADAMKENAREWLPEIAAHKNPFVVMGLFNLIDNLADNMPTIDPVKRGEWIFENRTWFHQPYLKCSCCGRRQFFARFDYCPYCGAKMYKQEEKK